MIHCEVLSLYSCALLVLLSVSCAHRLYANGLLRGCVIITATATASYEGDVIVLLWSTRAATARTRRCESRFYLP